MTRVELADELVKRLREDAERNGTELIDPHLEELRKYLKLNPISTNHDKEELSLGSVD